MGSLDGKWAVVTGGNSGIGKETVTELAARGASVVIASRNTELADAAAADIRRKQPGAKVQVEQLDLASNESVRSFAERYRRSGRPLHILVANAGANFVTQRKTPEGAPIMCQVNYLGHYALTRLLEPVLLASKPARVVSVSSVTHRLSWLADATRFLTQPAAATYRDTKLAQVLFTFELQRRLGRHGVQAAAVDPGGVRTNVWKGRFAKPPFSWYVDAFLAPAWDGAKGVVHAATADFSAESPPRQRRAPEHAELRLYAQGAYASPAMTCYPGPRPGLLGGALHGLFALTALLLSMLDWPVRRASGGRLWGGPRRAAAIGKAYNSKLAADLWQWSAAMLKLPVEPVVPSGANAS